MTDNSQFLCLNNGSILACTIKESQVRVRSTLLPCEPVITDQDSTPDAHRSLKTRGLEETRRKWEAHWSQALSDDDLVWLSGTAHCNHIRLPVGYWTLGPDFCQNTPFAKQPSQVYINAWAAATSIASRSFSHGIGILIDLHAGPGGFGHEAHSGSTTGAAEFWNSSSNRSLATRCLTFIAQQVASDPQLAGVVGIQICNEAIWDAPGMYEWYNQINEIVSSIDNTIPLYISDGWDMARALKFTRAYNTVETHGRANKCPVIVDNHRYYTFDEKDTSRSPEQLTEQISRDLNELDDSLVGNVFDHKAAVAVYIGEYSMALAPQTWNKADPSRHAELKQRFGHTQSRRWQEKATGSAFWTLKMDWMPGGDWGFREQVDAGNLSGLTCLSFSASRIRDLVARADTQRSELSAQAMIMHTDFWTKTAPGGSFGHHLFAQGWELGWSDARGFFVARLNNVVPHKNSHSETLESDVQIGADKIGALDLWVLQRMRQVDVARREKAAFGWEWEQGFRKGAAAWEVVVGIA